MSILFVTLYLDEDVDVLIARLVRAQGFDAITVLEAGRTRMSDPEQLEYAASVQRAIVTHNRRDFIKLAQEYTLAGRRHCGIILAVRRSPYQIAQSLLNLLNQITTDEMQDQVLYI